MRSRTFQKPIVGVGFAAVLVLGGWVWVHRIEAVYLPLCWRDVRELRAFEGRLDATGTEPEDPDAPWEPNEPGESNQAGKPGQRGESGEPRTAREARKPERDHLGLSALDRAACRLLRLQRPEFVGGRSFRLHDLLDEAGARRHLLFYEPIDVPFDAPPGTEADMTEVSPTEYLLQAVDSRGRLLGSPFRVPTGHVARAVIVETGCGERGGRGRRDVAIVSCCGGDYRLSIDEAGIVPEGARIACALRAPTARRASRKGRSDRSQILALLASPRKGDMYRALHLLENGDPVEGDLARPLLSDPDPDIRALAVAVCGLAPSLRPSLRPLLDDPEPLVRLSAVMAVVGGDGWEEAIAPVRADPHPEVVRAAHAHLVTSDRIEVRAPSALHLLRTQDPEAGRIDFERLPPTRELAEAAILYHHGCPPSRTDGRGYYPDLQHAFSYFPPDVLRPLAGEVCSLYRKLERCESCEPTFLDVLARIEDPEADTIVAGYLEGLSPNLAADLPSMCNILHALLAREDVGSPCLSAIERLVSGAERAGKSPGWELCARLVLLRAGRPEAEDGLRERLGRILEPFDPWNGWPWGFCPSAECWRRLPPGLFPSLLDLARRDPERWAQPVTDILSRRDRRELGPVSADLLDLYRAMRSRALPRMCLAMLLVRIEAGDDLISEELGDPASDDENPSAGILAALLEWRSASSLEGLVHAIPAIRRIACWSEGDVPETGWDPGDVTLPQPLPDGEPVDAGRSGAGFAYFLAPGLAPGTATWQLAAALLLERWGVPGGRELLAERLGEFGKDWRDTTLWSRFAPADLLAERPPPADESLLDTDDLEE